VSEIQEPLSGLPSAAISNAVVRLMHDYTGRGPTRARTYIKDDLIAVVLRDTLGPGGRALIQNGKREAVLTARRAFQELMATPLIAAVEEHADRGVVALLSASHFDPDIAVQAFILSPPTPALA
jgi:uncharacterized protein YbcI